MSIPFRNVSCSILFFTSSLSLTHTSAVLCQFGSTISLTSRRFSIVCMTPSAFTTSSIRGHPHRPNTLWSNTLCLCRVNSNFPFALNCSLREATVCLFPLSFCLSLFLSLSLSLSFSRVVDLPTLTLLESFWKSLTGWILPRFLL